VFERVAPGYHGGLYLEIVPRTFSILVRAGTRMNQLRLIRGTPLSSDALLSALHERDTLVYGSDDAPTDPMISEGLWISVDLAGSDDQSIIGYRALPNAPLVDLDRIAAYDPSDFWEPIERPKRSHLILNPEDFYILASKQRIHVPAHAAAELVGYDPSVGEFRIHYAGFFDPGFGYETEDARGAHAVLEVRSHEVPFVLEDNQRVGRFIYESLQAPPSRVYGPAIGSSYQSQGLSLSKPFKRWS
jgi:dCTP deaminase